MISAIPVVLPSERLQVSYGLTAHYGPNRCSRTWPSGAMRTTMANGSFWVGDSARRAPMNRMSFQRTVAVPVPQRPPHGGNVYGQVGFLDDDVWPDALHQGVLGDEVSTLLDEDQQQVEGLGCQGYRSTVPGEPALGGVDLEEAKREYVVRFRHSHTFRKLSDFFWTPLRTAVPSRTYVPGTELSVAWQLARSMARVCHRLEMGPL